MCYKCTFITHGRIVLAPQPCFKMSQWTVPPEDLNEQGKDNPSNVDPFYPEAAPAQQSAEDYKDYPEEMDEDNYVCSYYIEHNKTYI